MGEDVWEAAKLSTKDDSQSLLHATACLREKRQISQNQREGARQYCEYAPWLGVIVQIWHHVLESGSKKTPCLGFEGPKSIP